LSPSRRQATESRDRPAGASSTPGGGEPFTSPAQPTPVGAKRFPPHKVPHQSAPSGSRRTCRARSHTSRRQAVPAAQAAQGGDSAAHYPNCQYGTGLSGPPAEHARRVSNPQPPVLETGALPIELRAFIQWPGAESNCRHHDFQSCALPTELPGPATALPGNKNPRCRSGAGGHSNLPDWPAGLAGEVAGAGFEPATSGL
jgi:hypothetical protein